MSVMVVDAGNTRIKIVFWGSEVPVPDFRNKPFTAGTAGDEPHILGTLPTELLNSPNELSKRIKELIKGFDASSVLVSVIPQADVILKDIFPDLITVAKDGLYPFPHEINEPGTVGPDRWCNAAAAVSSGLDNALVIDAGTATTFDLLQDGVFKGGLIAPGMAFSAQQLALKGAMLEETPFGECPPVVGRNTREAMMGGSWMTGVGGVEWTISRLLETYGEMPLIITGGLARHLPSKGRYFDQYWTLRGAAFLAAKNHFHPGPAAD